MRIAISFVLLLITTLYAANCQESLIQNMIQEQNICHNRLDATVFFSGNMITHNSYGSLIGGGVKLRIFMWKRISFDSDLVIGRDYMHLGPGIIGIPIALLGAGFHYVAHDNESFFGFLIIAATVILSVEHIAYHFPMSGTLELSPFVSFLRFKELDIPENNYSHSNASFVAGLELNKYIKRFVISPYVEYNISYVGGLRGFNFGINAGYYFPKRR